MLYWQNICHDRLPARDMGKPTTLGLVENHDNCRASYHFFQFELLGYIDSTGAKYYIDSTGAK